MTNQQTPAAPEDIRSILVRCREFIDTTKIPAYPAGADLADEIDALLAAQAAPVAVKTQSWNPYCAAGVCLETDGVHDACCQRNVTQQPTKTAPAGEYPSLPTPDSYLFQHEETGVTQYVDSQQVEWGFEKNNPRLQRIGGAFTADQMRAYVDADRAARAPADSVTAPAYSIDADPQGIRARVAEAISGALAFGAQGANPPPTGHWLVPFWEQAREEASHNRPVSSDTLYLLRRLLSNQHTLTSAEFREELTKIVGKAAKRADSVLEDAEIDRIVPALEPVSEDFPAEWAVWKDRERIREELRAARKQGGA